MPQMGFFDLSDRYASLDGKKDPLVEIDAVVPWEEFRPTLERVWRKPDAERKSRAGRKPMDAVLMFKTLVLSALYNLSDDQIEYQVRDRLSFMRFLGLGLEGRVPDAKTVWLYREALAQAGMIEALFKQFDGYLARQGYIARGGQILDVERACAIDGVDGSRSRHRNVPHCVLSHQPMKGAIHEGDYHCRAGSCQDRVPGPRG
jgi:IS5 family transposase